MLVFKDSVILRISGKEPTSLSEVEVQFKHGENVGLQATFKVSDCSFIFMRDGKEKIVNMTYIMAYLGRFQFSHVISNSKSEGSK